MIISSMSKNVFLSLALASTLVITGCSSNCGSDSATQPTDTTPIVTPIIIPAAPTYISGKSVDGYLMNALVCLDLSKDSVCQGSTEPYSITDANGSFTLNLADVNTSSEEYKNALLLVSGGQDSDRPAKNFTGKLSALNDGTGKINITPLSSLVAKFANKNGTTTKESIASAKSKVASLLGVSEDDLGKDPRTSSNMHLIKVSLQIEYAVETLLEAAKDSNLTKAELSDKILAALAASLDNSSSTSIDKLIEDADFSSVGKDVNKVKLAAIASVKNIATVITASSNEELVKTITKIVVLQNIVVTKIMDTNITANTFVFTSEDLASMDFNETELMDINFSLETVKIYLKDLGVDVNDSVAAKYIDLITFDKTLDELKEIVKDNEELTEAVDDKIDEIDEEKKDIEDTIKEELAKTTMETLKNDVNSILAPSVVANVADAKTMINNIRELGLTFADLNGSATDDLGNTQIIGGEAKKIVDNIQPAVENMVNDFENTATKMESSLRAFANSFEPNFKDVSSDIETRLRNIYNTVKDKNYDQNWSVSVNGDMISNVYSKDASNVITNTIFFNAQSITTTWKEKGSNEFVPLSLSKIGNITISADNYELNVTSLSFTDTKAIILASGYMNGINNSTIAMQKFDAAFDFNDTKEQLNKLSDVVATIDGKIVTDNRMFVGSINIKNGALHTMNGNYTSLYGEPSFVGTIDLDLSLNTLLSDINEYTLFTAPASGYNFTVEQNLTDEVLIDRAFGLEISGTITDGSKIAKATFGITSGTDETTLFVKGVEITDGISSMKASAIMASFSRTDFVNNENANPTAVSLNNLEMSIVDNDNAKMKFLADIAYTKDLNNKVIISFNGDYTYGTTVFNGVIKAQANVSDVSTIGFYSITGKMESNGFEPFELTSSGILSANDDIEAYVMISKGTHYKIGAKITNESSLEYGHITTINLADSNGVMANYQDYYNDQYDLGLTQGVLITNKTGAILGEFGKKLNGNEWEIKYSDNASETIF